MLTLFFVVLFKISDLIWTSTIGEIDSNHDLILNALIHRLFSFVRVEDS